MAMVRVKVSSKGVVLHSHEGCEGYHDPNRAHDRSTELHDGIGAQVLLKAQGLKDLTADQRAQYKAALRYDGHDGKTFWVYPPKKATPAATPVAAALAEAAEVAAQAFETGLVQFRSK